MIGESVMETIWADEMGKANRRLHRWVKKGPACGTIRVASLEGLKLEPFHKTFGECEDESQVYQYTSFSFRWLEGEIEAKALADWCVQFLELWARDLLPEDVYGLTMKPEGLASRRIQGLPALPMCPKGPRTHEIVERAPWEADWQESFETEQACFSLWGRYARIPKCKA